MKTKTNIDQRFLEFSDICQAQAKRDDGIAKAKENEQLWADRCVIALERYLKSSKEFFVDEFWDAEVIEKPDSMRAFGAVVLHAAKKKWIAKSGVYRKSVRSNLSEKAVWTSLIYEGANNE